MLTNILGNKDLIYSLEKKKLLKKFLKWHVITWNKTFVNNKICWKCQLKNVKRIQKYSSSELNYSFTKTWEIRLSWNNLSHLSKRW